LRPGKRAQQKNRNVEKRASHFGILHRVAVFASLLIQKSTWFVRLLQDTEGSEDMELCQSGTDCAKFLPMGTTAPQASIPYRAKAQMLILLRLMPAALKMRSDRWPISLREILPRLKVPGAREGVVRTGQSGRSNGRNSPRREWSSRHPERSVSRP
jgi:hypothetical protein